ncbi:hypothetical protein H2198_007262 [Neophaeococcomyces mojaviensis]|uniref:Uncharacterized protein n=1 Tax=Neophaeococcomyces mojaviensis TaxID=3383035 RepID=A0ACC3A0G2_9EURO|nr:hypothetical protein H2198_007262 [Knufia sp. JES_112]
MSSKEKRPLLKTKVQKKPMKATDGGSIKYENELRFEDNVGDQRVVVFDSSSAPEPFMDTNELEALRKKQKAEAEKAKAETKAQNLRR